VAEHRVFYHRFRLATGGDHPIGDSNGPAYRSRAIFDFSMMGVEGLLSFLRKTAPAGHIRDIKISVPAFFDPSLGRLLKETGVHDIWVECHPQFFSRRSFHLSEEIEELSEDHRCFPIVGDTDLLTAILKESSGIRRIVPEGMRSLWICERRDDHGSIFVGQGNAAHILRASRHPHLGRRLHP